MILSYLVIGGEGEGSTVAGGPDVGEVGVEGGRADDVVPGVQGQALQGPGQGEY